MCLGAMSGSLPQFVQAREQSQLLSAGGEPTTQDGEVLFIWGTNIHLTTLQARLRRFFSNFTAPGTEEPKYMELMSQARPALLCGTALGVYQRPLRGVSRACRPHHSAWSPAHLLILQCPYGRAAVQA